MINEQDFLSSEQDKSMNKDQEQQSKPSQSQKRSREALDRRNKRRYEKKKSKQQQHTIRRDIHTQWTLRQIKQVLNQHSIRYGRIPQPYGNSLRIQFNNQSDQDLAEISLPLDTFSEENFKRWIHTQE